MKRIKLADEGNHALWASLLSIFAKQKNLYAMNKTLPTPTGSFLLENALEKLHRESMDWLEEIDYWKDEAAFFYSLMLRKKPRAAVAKTKQAKEVEQELIRLSADHMVALRQEVNDHENDLSRIIDSKLLDEQPYRQAHEELREHVQEVRLSFRKLKQDVFKLVKTSPVKKSTKIKKKDAALV